MSFTRLGQISGEIRSTDEGILPAFRRAVTSSNYAKTGSYSIQCVTARHIGIGFEQQQVVRAACHFLIPSFGYNSFYPLFFTARGSTGVTHGLRADSDTETVHLYVDGVSVETVPFAQAGIAEDQWFHCAMTFDGANGLINAWGNDWLIFDYATTFSSSSVNGAWSGVLGLAATFCYMDNLYADIMVDEPFDERPPKKHFFFKKPNAPGEYDDWTVTNESANWRAVDDTPHNSDTDYNKALATSLLDTFETTTVSIPEDDDVTTWIVRAVIPHVIIKRNDVAKDCNVRTVVYDGLNFSYGDTEQYVGIGYQHYWHRFEQQPDGSLWNRVDINGMEYGYQSQGTFS